MPNAPARAPLFLEGTPSVAGTPRHNAVARRAMGLSTPRRQQTPLFARKQYTIHYLPSRMLISRSWYIIPASVPELLPHQEDPRSCSST